MRLGEYLAAYGVKAPRSWIDRRYRWRQFEKDCRTITKMLISPPAQSFGSKPILPGIVEVGLAGINSIYGIPRGGQVVAVRLSYMTGLPLVEFLEITSTTLIVDDIVGTGKTMTEFLRKVPTKYFATLFLTEDMPKCRTIHTSYNDALEIYFLYGQIIHEGVFVKFPWAPEDEFHE